MFLKSGTIIPFIFNDTKKLIAIHSSNKNETLQLDDVKTAINSAFDHLPKKCEFYNPKIGFKIPDELFIIYMEQRHDLTNFVVKIVEIVEIREEEYNLENLQPHPDPEQQHKSTEANKSNEKRASAATNDSPKQLTKFKPDYVDLYLENILKISDKGQEICNNFDSTNKLSDRDRIALLKLVTNFEFKKLVDTRAPKAVDTKRLAQLSDAIVHRFPGEDPSEYFLEHPQSLKYIAGGKLYEYFLEKRLDYYDQLARIYNLLSDSELSRMGADFPDLEEWEEMKGDWNSIFKAWQYTYPLRMAHYYNVVEREDYLEKISHSVRRNELVDYDFNRIHPNKSNNLFDNWDRLSERIFNAAILKGCKEVALIRETYGHMSELSKCMELSYFYQNYEQEVQPFKKDYPGNLVVHIETIEGDPEEFLYDLGCSETPSVYALGKIDDLKFYVATDILVIHMETALKAVDFCFKCHEVLSMYYSSEQEPIWELIQNAFYKIYTGKTCKKIDKFLNFLNDP